VLSCQFGVLVHRGTRRHTDRYTNAYEFALLQRRSNGIDRVAESNAYAHSEYDPYYQEAVQERETFQRRKLFLSSLVRYLMSITQSGILCSTTVLLTCGVHQSPAAIACLLLDVTLGISISSLLLCDCAALNRVHCVFEIEFG
jgi:hypothetical protein